MDPLVTGSPRTRRRRAGLLAVVAGVLLLVVPMPTSHAEDTNRVADAGWWWRVQAGIGVPVPAPPNVEPGQLMVQSTVEGEQAIAAVDLVVAEGQTNPILTLTVASEGGGAGAVLLACQAGSAWIGEDAGRWDARPQADCSTSVTGIAAEDGSSWTFPLGTLQFGDRVNVVLVPGKLADSDANPTFNLVFDEPTAESIETSAGQAPPPTTRPPTTEPTPPPTFDSGGSGFAPAPTSPAPTIAPAPPVLPAQPVLDEEGQGLADDAPVVRAGEELAAAVAAPEPRTVARVIGFLVLLGGVAMFALSSRSPFVAPAATGDAPVEGGLARFRSARTTEPDPIS